MTIEISESGWRMSVHQLHRQLLAECKKAGERGRTTFRGERQNKFARVGT